MEDTNRNIKKSFILAGLGLQVFALIFAYLCLAFIPYIGWLPAFYLSPIIFIAGIIFVFFSRIKLIYKFLLGFWIIVVPIGIIGERYYQKQFIQNEVYLIPKNYHGEASVNFGKSDGIVPDTENNAVVLKINSNGTLKTTYVAKRLRNDLEQETENYREYYLVDETGNRTKLPFKRELPQPISETNEVLIVPFGSYFSSDSKTIDKIEFFVGTAAELSETLKKK